MIRKTGFLLIVIIPVAAALALYVFRNQIVAGIAESALSTMLDTEVTIEGVDLDPLAMQAKFGKLRIVDGDNPAQYLLIAGPGQFNMNGLQLFAGKVIVESLQVDNLGMGVPRPPGEVPKSPPKRKRKKRRKSKQGGPGKQDGAGQAGIPSTATGEAEEEDSPDFNLEIPTLNLDALRGDVDVDLLMGDKKLASLEAVDEAEKIGTDRLNKLESGLAKGNFGPRYKKVKDAFKGIAFNSKNPKKLKDSLSALKQANNSAKSLGRDIKKYSDDTKAGYRAIKAGFKNIDRKIDEDLASIKSLANLGDLDASKVGQILFGQGVLDQFNWIMGKVRLARNMLGSDDDSADIEPARRAGRVITYPVTGRAYPTFLVESTGFTGFTSAQSGKVDLNYSGKMTGLSSNARVYGKPLIITAKAGRGGESTWSIRGNFDHTKTIGKDSILISGRRVELGEFKMAGGDLMPQKAIANNGTVDIDFGVSGERIKGRMKVIAKRLNFVFEGKAPAGDKLAGILRDLFKGIKNADVSATLGGTFSNPKFNIKSSIDDIFWQRTKQIFKQRVAETNRKLRKNIKDRVNKKRAEAEATIKARQTKLTAKFNKVKKQADALKAAYTQKKKAGEAKLRAMLKRAGGDKVKEKLKKLFN